MKTKKKNKFFTFCLSFIPGAAEMYMGFMKRGISLMGIMCFSIVITIFLNIPVLIPVIVIIWFYSFFEANNLAALDDNEFARIEDQFLFGVDLLDHGKANIEKYHKWIAYVLIGFGVVLLWNTGMDILIAYMPERLQGIIYSINSTVPQIVVAFLVIAGGIKMIQGKKKVLFKEDGEE